MATRREKKKGRPVQLTLPLEGLVLNPYEKDRNYDPLSPSPGGKRDPEPEERGGT